MSPLPWSAPSTQPAAINDFDGPPPDRVDDDRPRKLASASLNLSTYVTLYDYGYRNVYELAPLLDVRTTKVRLVSGEETAR